MKYKHIKNNTTKIIILNRKNKIIYLINQFSKLITINLNNKHLKIK